MEQARQKKEEMLLKILAKLKEEDALRQRFIKGTILRKIEKTKQEEFSQIRKLGLDKHPASSGEDLKPKESLPVLASQKIEEDQKLTTLLKPRILESKSKEDHEIQRWAVINELERAKSAITAPKNVKHFCKSTDSKAKANEIRVKLEFESKRLKETFEARKKNLLKLNAGYSANNGIESKIVQSLLKQGEKSHPPVYYKPKFKNADINNAADKETPKILEELKLKLTPPPPLQGTRKAVAFNDTLGTTTYKAFTEAKFKGSHYYFPCHHVSSVNNKLKDFGKNNISNLPLAPPSDIKKKISNPTLAPPSDIKKKIANLTLAPQSDFKKKIANLTLAAAPPSDFKKKIGNLTLAPPSDFQKKIANLTLGAAPPSDFQKKIANLTHAAAPPSNLIKKMPTKPKSARPKTTNDIKSTPIGQFKKFQTTANQK